jgi:hypothetical protein
MSPAESAIIKAMQKYGDFSIDTPEIYLYFYEQIGDTKAVQDIKEGVDELNSGTLGVFSCLDVKDYIHKTYSGKIYRTLRKLAAKGEVIGYWYVCREKGTFDGMPTKFRGYKLKNATL